MTDVSNGLMLQRRRKKNLMRNCTMLIQTHTTTMMTMLAVLALIGSQKQGTIDLKSLF